MDHESDRSYEAEISSENSSELSSDCPSPTINASLTTIKCSQQRAKAPKRKRKKQGKDSTSHTGSHAAGARSTVPKKCRKKTSIIWNHCHIKVIEGKVYTVCNYCDKPKAKWNLHGTSLTPLYHV